jgi:hypothetical protein
MIRIVNQDNIHVELWEKLLSSSSVSSFFQTKACYDFYSKLNFLTPFLYGVTEDDKLVGLACGYLIADGGVVKRYFSRRAIIPGGLLLADDIGKDALISLLDALKMNLSAKAIYLEIRNYGDYAPFRGVLQQQGFDYLPHLNIQVPLTSVNSAFDQLSNSKQRQVRQTEKSGVVFYLSDNHDDIMGFYQILKKLYKQKVKKPLFPAEFFLKVVKQDFTRFFVVKKDEQVIGGILCVTNGQVLYEWFICGDENTGKGIYPSVFATWKAIEYAVNHGFAYFDFMGAGKPDKQYGVRDFKVQFGGRVLEQGRFLYLCKPGLYRFSKNMLHIIQKLKY